MNRLTEQDLNYLRQLQGLQAESQEEFMARMQEQGAAMQNAGIGNLGSGLQNAIPPEEDRMDMKSIEDSAVGEILRWVFGYPMAFVAGAASVAWFGMVLTWW